MTKAHHSNDGILDVSQYRAALCSGFENHNNNNNNNSHSNKNSDSNSCTPSNPNPSLPPGAAERLEELCEALEHEKTTDALLPYAVELEHRLSYLNAQLCSDCESGFQFLCSPSVPCYADVFMVVMLASIDSLVKSIDTAKYGAISKWRTAMCKSSAVNEACEMIKTSLS